MPRHRRTLQFAHRSIMRAGWSGWPRYTAPMQTKLPLPGAHCAYPHRPGLRERLSHPLHFPFRLWAENLTRRPVEFLFVTALLLALLGASALWLADRGVPASGLHSWWDGLWLTVTSINENYGDVRPATSLARLAAGIVATLGALLVGSFTAVVTNYLLGDEHRELVHALREINDRLERLEQGLREAGPGAGRGAGGNA
jgi:hypothetical protein